MKQKNCDVQQLNRRGFLKVGGVLGGALCVSWALPAWAQTPQTPEDAKPKSQGPEAFLHLLPGNKLEVVANRLEFGQGITTAFALIVCEELDFPLKSVSGGLGGNNPVYNDPVMGVHLTGGSSSIKNSYDQYRKLGATLRQMLVTAAAAKWKIKTDEVKTENGYVISGKKRMAYFDLAEEVAKLPVPEHVNLKEPKSFKLIGKPARRIDAKDIVDGKKAFGIDLKLENLKVALVLRPPTFTGAKVGSFDANKATRMKGVQAVFKVPLDRGSEGVAVVAETFWAAKQARDAVQVEWLAGESAGLSSEKLFADFAIYAKNPEKVALDWTDPKAAEQMTAAEDRIVYEFQFPYLAHASMEPLNCTVELKDGSCEIWSGSQMPGGDTFAVSQATGLPPEKIKINVLPSGGGFGRRATATSDFVTEAAQVAKAWVGQGGKGPVKVIWLREDDMKGGYYRPMHVHRAELAFDKSGALLAWDHSIVGQSIVMGSPFEKFMVKDGVDSTMVKGLIDNYYHLPMRLRITHPQLPIPVLWWRSVEHTHTAYVMETLTDEIARRMNADPVVFRLSRLKPDQIRLKQALELAVKESGYNTRKLDKGQAWGVAMHESFNTAVAYVVTVSLVDGKPIVHEVTAGVHCNRVINPLTAKAQIEGGMIFGLSTLLPGAAITLKDGAVEQDQFTNFTVARMKDAPAKVAVHFVESQDAPTGLGEPGLPPVIPAVANAVAVLTGKMPTRLPLN